jgi:hypothetical protein
LLLLLALLLAGGLAAFVPHVQLAPVAPAIVTPDSTTFTVGSPGRFVISTTGSPTAALGESGFLGGHLSFIDNGDGTATLSGTPIAGSAGVYHFKVVATNGVAPDATQAFRLTIVRAATSLAAAPAVSLSPVNLLSLSATLTGPGGVPLTGQPLTFTAGGATLCQALTDTSGGASCLSLGGVLAVVLAGHYQAVFAGNGTYAPSRSESPLLG